MRYPSITKITPLRKSIARYFCLLSKLEISTITSLLKIKDLATSLKKRVDLGFNNVLNRTNPYMQYVVLGKFNTLPDYLKEENYEIIKSNLHKIELVCADFKEAIKMYKSFRLIIP